MKTIGVFTRDFSLYYDVIKILKKRKIPYVSLSSEKDIPSKVGVVLTSNKEIHDIKTPKVIAADAYDSVSHAVDLAMQMLIGKELYSKVFIGIDPGEKPGLAVVGDDILLQKNTAESPKDVKDVVKRLLKSYPAMERLIRIGHGSPIIRNRIINSLISLEIPIEIVDESKTSSSLKTSRKTIDGESAAAIALLPGGRVQSRLPLTLTKGEIRRVQNQSRILTNGRFSISQKSAADVLRGKLSLREAIEIEKRE